MVAAINNEENVRERVRAIGINAGEGIKLSS